MTRGLIFAAATIVGATSLVSATYAQNSAGMPTNGIAAASALPQTPLKAVAKQGTIANEATPPASSGQAALPAMPAPFVANTAK